MGQPVPFRRPDDRIAPLLVIHGDQIFKLDPAEWISFYRTRGQINDLLRAVDTVALHNLWQAASQLSDRVMTELKR